MSEGVLGYRGFPPWKPDGLGNRQYDFPPGFYLVIVTMREAYL